MAKTLKELKEETGWLRLEDGRGVLANDVRDMFSNCHREDPIAIVGRDLLESVLNGADLDALMEDGMEDQHFSLCYCRNLLETKSPAYREAVAQDIINKAGLQKAMKVAPEGKKRRM